MRNLIFTVSALLVSALTLSCSEDKGGNGPVMTGQTIMVPNEQGVAVPVTLDFDSDWQVESTEAEWFYVSPLKGPAGPTEINIHLQDANTEHTERVATFTINSGGVLTQYYVIQDVAPGIDVPSVAMIGVDGGEFVFTLNSNVRYEAVPEQDWITVNDIKYDSTLLADNVTYSKYMISRINMTVEANDGNVRDGVITLKGEDGVTEAVIDLTQMGQLSADYSSQFLRRSVVMRFTATWCGNCPRMNEGLVGAIEQDPRHILPLTMHVWGSAGGLNSDVGEAYAEHFAVDGLPSGYMNTYADIRGTYSAPIIKELINGLADEATHKLPANTMVAGSTRIEEGSIVVDLGIASKQAGDYYVSVFVLEDGIVYAQTGGSSEYVHNAVTRAEMTPMWGEPVSLSAEGLLEKTFSMPVPESVMDQSKLHILAVVNKKGTFSGDVKYATYRDWEYVVDNAVDIPINGFSVFEYE